MKCPFCGASDTRVLDTRTVGDGTVVRRRRECPVCGSRFTTYERFEPMKILVIKKDGRRELYQREKLLNGIMKACEKRPVSYEEMEEVVNRIESKIFRSGKQEILSKDIGDMVMNELKRLDHVAYVRFASVYREFADIDSFLEVINELKSRREKENE